MAHVTKLFLSNRSQAVEMHASGKECIISPVGQLWDSFFHGGPAVPDDYMAERSSQAQPDGEAI